MDWQKIFSNLEKIIPVAIVAGLLADWCRLRLARRLEERKHIARAISELLELRYVIRGLPELPKHFQKLMPKELGDQLPPDFFQSLDIMQFLPMDDELSKRYKKAVEEIAGFNPFLAFQLRGKERYFDFRNFLSQHLSQSPGSQIIANQTTEILDRQCAPVIEDALLLLGKSHGLRMRFAVKISLRRKPVDDHLIPPATVKVIQDQIRQIIAAMSSQISQPPTPCSSSLTPKPPA